MTAAMGYDLAALAGATDAPLYAAHVLAGYDLLALLDPGAAGGTVTIALVSPANGTPVGSDPLVFDLSTSDGSDVVLAFAVIRTAVNAPTPGPRECAYDRRHPAGPWDPAYAKASSLVTLGPGRVRLTLIRAGGWPGGGVGAALEAASARGAVSS